MGLHNLHLYEFIFILVRVVINYLFCGCCNSGCYGVQKYPLGQLWLCQKCQVVEKGAVVVYLLLMPRFLVLATLEIILFTFCNILIPQGCLLCPSKDGAMKKTNEGNWVHVVCALYMPGVKFGNVNTMSKIKLGKIPQAALNNVYNHF